MNRNWTETQRGLTPITITVRSLRAQHDGAEILVGILLESGEQREQKSLPISAEQYYSIQPSKGEISEEMYERLEAASQLCLAMRCGENLLSYAPNSVHTLAQKLTQRGYPREVAQRAAAKLSEMGLIDERRDVCREVEKCLRKLWGAKRIRDHLWSRGFAQESLEELPDLLQEVDFVANCASMIRKHYGEVPREADEMHRMTASLSRYGYSISEIKAAIVLLLNEA
ncbi:MAG: RecX family transcriptional regulator [Clostridia bacterium]|nr:RecX family transcriptional regulator [Clostridia bacterium]